MKRRNLLLGALSLAACRGTASRQANGTAAGASAASPAAGSSLASAPGGPAGAAADTPRRGHLVHQDFGAVRATFRSGIDTPATAPLHDLTACEVALENRGAVPVALGYNAQDTFIHGYRFVLGAGAGKPHSVPRDQHAGWHPEDNVSLSLAPGESLYICRMDFMMLFDQVTQAGLGDGMVTAFYEAVVQIDSRSETLKFGPHRFRVALNRDWQTDYKLYEQLIKL